MFLRSIIGLWRAVFNNAQPYLMAGPPDYFSKGPVWMCAGHASTFGRSRRNHMCSTFKKPFLPKRLGWPCPVGTISSKFKNGPTKIWKLESYFALDLAIDFAMKTVCVVNALTLLCKIFKSKIHRIFGIHITQVYCSHGISTVLHIYPFFNGLTRIYKLLHIATFWEY